MILSRFNQDWYYFSQFYEMRIGFINSIRDMTYDYYLKQSKSMCEIKLNEIIAKNPKLINSFKKNTSHCLIRKCSNVSQAETLHFFVSIQRWMCRLNKILRTLDFEKKQYYIFVEPLSWIILQFIKSKP